MRISGLVKFGGASSLGGATLAGFDLADGAGRSSRSRASSTRSARRRSPASRPAQLATEIRTILPPGTQVRTGDAQASEDAKDTESFLNFLQDFLLAFGGIALFVGSFVIANSLSITIAQRTRELATLRTLGASRRQVLGSIVVEALVMGVLVVGRRHLPRPRARHRPVQALRRGRLHAAEQRPRPSHAHRDRRRCSSGILVTLLASLRPAFRATRVPPIAAVREGAALPESRFARFRTPRLGAADAIVGFAALVYGLFGSGLSTTQILVYMGLGTLLIFFGVALLSARIARPLAQLLGWPATKFGGAAGALARDNARRNPQRTASTASALMIGLALVTLVAVLAAGITKSFRGAVDDLWISGYAVTAENNFSPIPIAAGEAAAQTPGVQAIANVRGGDALVFNKVIQATAINPQVGRHLQPEVGVRLGPRARDARPARRLRRQGLREESPPPDRLAPDSDLAARHCPRARGAGHLRPAGGRLPVRARDDLVPAPGTGSTTSRRTSTRSSECAAARRTRTRPRSSAS